MPNQVSSQILAKSKNFLLTTFYYQSWPMFFWKSDIFLTAFTMRPKTAIKYSSNYLIFGKQTSKWCI